MAVGAAIGKWKTPEMTIACPPSTILPHGVMIIVRKVREQALVNDLKATGTSFRKENRW